VVVRALASKVVLYYVNVRFVVLQDFYDLFDGRPLGGVIVSAPRDQVKQPIRTRCRFRQSILRADVIFHLFKTKQEWSSYGRIWFLGPDKQEILILISILTK
jgi:hypothetical protein